MKRILTSILLLTLLGCSSHNIPKNAQLSNTPQICEGNLSLPQSLAASFEPVEDTPLLNSALGNSEQGKLCQGQVYKSKQGSKIALFRAWNSTNPNSKYGKWWAFQKPSGEISTYRSDYEICYQWSPLDKLVSCTLEPGTKVVVGTGQSAKCSEYLSYPVSDKQQIYIDNAATSVTNCTVYDGVFSWK